MKATISLDSLWATIQSLSINNQKWLASKLQENIRAKEEAETEYISKEELLKPSISAKKSCWRESGRGWKT